MEDGEGENGSSGGRTKEEEDQLARIVKRAKKILILKERGREIR